MKKNKTKTTKIVVDDEELDMFSKYGVKSIVKGKNEFILKSKKK